MVAGEKKERHYERKVIVLFVELLKINLNTKQYLCIILNSVKITECFIRTKILNKTVFLFTFLLFSCMWQTILKGVETRKQFVVNKNVFSSFITKNKQYNSLCIVHVSF